MNMKIKLTWNPASIRDFIIDNHYCELATLEEYKAIINMGKRKCTYKQIEKLGLAICATTEQFQSATYSDMLYLMRGICSFVKVKPYYHEKDILGGIIE